MFFGCKMNLIEIVPLPTDHKGVDSDQAAWATKIRRGVGPRSRTNLILGRRDSLRSRV